MNSKPEIQEAVGGYFRDPQRLRREERHWPGRAGESLTVTGEGLRVELLETSMGCSSAVATPSRADKGKSCC